MGKGEVGRVSGLELGGSFLSEHSESLLKGVKQGDGVICWMFDKDNLDRSLEQQVWEQRDQAGAR